MSLVEALHGRAAMTGVRAPWPAMGTLSEREGRGRGERGKVGKAAGCGEEEGGDLGLHDKGARPCCWALLCVPHVASQ
jgi:hypothetical protein